jgi:hypothetical protein
MIFSYLREAFWHPFLGGTFKGKISWWEHAMEEFP